jgi:adenine deaminase
MSLEPLESVAQELAKLDALAAGLGCTLAAPFATLSFLALPVIPEIKLTDLGLVDAAKVEMIPV